MNTIKHIKINLKEDEMKVKTFLPLPHQRPRVSTSHVVVFSSTPEQLITVLSQLSMLSHSCCYS